MTTPQTHTKGGTTEVWVSLGWNRNVIGMIFAQWKGWFLCNSGRTPKETFPAEFAHTVIGYHCPSRRPSREEARWWRRLPEWEKGKENGGAGIEPWVGLLSC